MCVAACLISPPTSFATSTKYLQCRSTQSTRLNMAVRCSVTTLSDASLRAHYFFGCVSQVLGSISFYSTVDIARPCRFFAHQRTTSSHGHPINFFFVPHASSQSNPAHQFRRRVDSDLSRDSSPRNVLVIRAPHPTPRAARCPDTVCLPDFFVENVHRC